MCIGTPKPPKPDPSAAKAPDPAIIRNPYLDGIDPETRARRKGRSTLRIERGSGRATSSPPASSSPSPTSAPAAAAGSPRSSTVGVGGAMKQLPGSVYL